jgi:phosphotriesterase-related protein
MARHDPTRDVPGTAGGHVHTVTGPVRSDELGPTLLHEHVLIDFRCRYAPAEDEDQLSPDQPDPDDRARLLARPAGYLVNLLRTDRAEAETELHRFREAGGGTVVDLTTLGLGPDPLGLRDLSVATGVHIVAGTGVYIGRSAPAWVATSRVEQLTERFVADVSEGGAEGVLRGVIGEIGVEDFTDVEFRCFDAATAAHRETGAPVFAHVLSGARPQDRPRVVDLVRRFVDAGGDPTRLVLCHQDGSGDDPAYQDRVLALGAVLAYDTFGFEARLRRPDGDLQLPTDDQRIREVARIEREWGPGRVVVSHDLCYRMMLSSWGGWGWTHLFALRDRFAEHGVDGSAFDRLLVATPAALLTLP